VKKLAWRQRQPARNCLLERDDLAFIHRHGYAAMADNVDDSWSSEHGQPIEQVKAAKQIPRQQRQLDLLRPVSVPMPLFVQWKKDGVSLALQDHTGRLLVPRFHS
jgi:hypothetical protein